MIRPTACLLLAVSLLTGCGGVAWETRDVTWDRRPIQPLGQPARLELRIGSQSMQTGRLRAGIAMPDATIVTSGGNLVVEVFLGRPVLRQGTADTDRQDHILTGGGNPLLRPWLVYRVACATPVRIRVQAVDRPPVLDLDTTWNATRQYPPQGAPDDHHFTTVEALAEGYAIDAPHLGQEVSADDAAQVVALVNGTLRDEFCVVRVTDRLPIATGGDLRLTEAARHADEGLRLHLIDTAQADLANVRALALLDQLVATTGDADLRTAALLDRAFVQIQIGQYAAAAADLDACPPTATVHAKPLRDQLLARQARDLP